MVLYQPIEIDDNATIATIKNSNQSREVIDNLTIIKEEDKTNTRQEEEWMYFTLTAYTNGPESTGKRPGDKGYAITASGKRTSEGRTIAADPRVLPMGTKVYIEGVGERIVEDTGSAIKGHKIDVFIEDLDQALEFGRKSNIRVKIIE